MHNKMPKYSQTLILAIIFCITITSVLHNCIYLINPAYIQRTIFLRLFKCETLEKVWLYCKKDHLKIVRNWPLHIKKAEHEEVIQINSYPPIIPIKKSKKRWNISVYL